MSAPGELRPAGEWGHRGAVAIRKARVAGWLPFKWQRIGRDDSLFTGCVPSEGKNGKRKWPKPHTQVVVTQAEADAEADAYESEHGRCRECYGSGQEWRGWSLAQGNKYEPCKACGATGLPAKARGES